MVQRILSGLKLSHVASREQNKLRIPERNKKGRRYTNSGGLLPFDDLPTQDPLVFSLAFRCEPGRKDYSNLQRERNIGTKCRNGSDVGSVDVTHMLFLHSLFQGRDHQCLALWGFSWMTKLSVMFVLVGVGLTYRVLASVPLIL